MKHNRPFAPFLPGRFAQMTREQLDAESDQYDVEFSASRARRVSNARPHPRKRGRPPKPEREKAARVLITMPPRLLAAADAAAEQRGLSRAALIQQAIANHLSQQERRRKSA